MLMQDPMPVVGVRKGRGGLPSWIAIYLSGLLLKDKNFLNPFLYVCLLNVSDVTHPGWDGVLLQALGLLV